MIQDQDRSGWFGASDTAIIMGNWKTKTFKSWWLQKLGLSMDKYTSRAMNAGTYYEHAILDHIGAPRRDHQILLPEMNLRVNLDGDCMGRIWEVKTHKAEKAFKVTRAYWQQVQVQMFAKLKVEKVIPNAEIVAYALTDADYRNFFNEIDHARLRTYHIGYDAAFIHQYLVRLEYLRKCLLEGVFPDEIPG